MGPVICRFQAAPQERWTTTRFYFLEFVNDDVRREYSRFLPLYSTKWLLNFPEKEDDDNKGAAARDEGEFFIEEITGKNGETPSGKILEMRLRDITTQMKVSGWIPVSFCANNLENEMELSEYCESLAKACEDAGNWVGRNEDVVRNEKEGLLKELRRAKRSFQALRQGFVTKKMCAGVFGPEPGRQILSHIRIGQG